LSFTLLIENNCVKIIVSKTDRRWLLSQNGKEIFRINKTIGRERKKAEIYSSDKISSQPGFKPFGFMTMLRALTF